MHFCHDCVELTAKRSPPITMKDPADMEYYQETLEPKVELRKAGYDQEDRP